MGGRGNTRRTSEKRGREEDFKMGTDGMSCQEGVRKQKCEILYMTYQNRDGIASAGTKQVSEVGAGCVFW